jgi:RimJ/RimL family protein N-acetyltransferase
MFVLVSPESKKVMKTCCSSSLVVEVGSDLGQERQAMAAKSSRFLRNPSGFCFLPRTNSTTPRKRNTTKRPYEKINGTSRAQDQRDFRMCTAASKIEIRPRLHSDLPSCASLLARVHEKDRLYPVQGVSNAIGFLSSPSTLASWVAVAEAFPGSASSNNSTQDENPRILAHISLSLPPPTSTDPAVVLWRSQNSQPVAVLERLFVDPAARGQGLAEKLIKTVTEEAGKRGLRCVLFALVKAVGAMRLYERVGWEVFGREMYGYEDGEGEWREMEAVCYVAPDASSSLGKRRM